MASFTTTATTHKAVLLPPTTSGLCNAGERLRSGGLVAFPTETVYGLGANALDEAAVRSIFTTKGRPLTDPLIVHVPTQTEALNLLELDSETASIYELLATTFWPGPLTLVGKAVAAIPLAVTAGTGFVGIRCPKHDLARRLLIEARVPVAAPSANRFGHVSPTTAHHVYQDLGTHDIAIVDGESSSVDSNSNSNSNKELKTDGKKKKNTNKETCSVGIESTVLKVDGDTKTIVLFRRGGISEAALRKALDGTGYTIQALNKQVPHDPSAVPKEDNANANDTTTTTEIAATENGQQAPGQCLTHYAPDVSTSLVHNTDTTVEVCPAPLSSCVVIDFGGHLAHLETQVLGYRDLSKNGDVSEAAHQLFDTLRWTEGVEGAVHVLLTDVRIVEAERAPNKLLNYEHLEAVADRMFRAASGRCVKLEI